MKYYIVALTQIYENYGNRWKPKGGDMYTLKEFESFEDFNNQVKEAGLTYADYIQAQVEEMEIPNGPMTDTAQLHEYREYEQFSGLFNEEEYLKFKENEL